MIPKPSYYSSQASIHDENAKQIQRNIITSKQHQKIGGQEVKRTDLPRRDPRGVLFVFSVPRLSTIGQGKASRRLGRGKEQLKKLRRNQGRGDSELRVLEGLERREWGFHRKTNWPSTRVLSPSTFVMATSPPTSACPPHVGWTGKMGYGFKTKCKGVVTVPLHKEKFQILCKGADRATLHPVEKLHT